MLKDTNNEIKHKLHYVIKSITIIIQNLFLSVFLWIRLKCRGHGLWLKYIHVLN